MRITVLVGSPRRNGNTETLADALIAGAEAAGAEVTKFSLRGKKIAPCVNCDFCKTHDRCAVDDDMTAVYDLLVRTDALVLATPVYFYNMSAQLKALLDRLYNPVRAKIPVKHTALLAVCADDTQKAFDPLRATFAAVEDFLGWKRAGEVTVHSVEKRGDIAGNEALERARALGEKIAGLSL
jgi:multimeric flavodoxin WrbA